jgi:DNA-binding GntR family transcriptional regulator
MLLGAYTACLHDRSLDQALAILHDLGLTGAEINAGGFIPSPHLPIEAILADAGAREAYLGRFAAHGITLTGLNCNGNPLHPDPEVGRKHAADLVQAIELAGLLGVKRVVTMSGLPAAHAGGTAPSWTVVPWDSVYLDALDYQWSEVAIPFWTRIDALAAAADVKVCIEMHPGHRGQHRARGRLARPDRGPGSGGREPHRRPTSPERVATGRPFGAVLAPYDLFHRPAPRSSDPGDAPTTAPEARVTDLQVLVDQSSPVPLYHQVARQLEESISAGRLAKGEFLPGEIELAGRWGVSRPTARRAIQELVDAGLLVRRRGVGTQVVSAQLRRQAALTSLYDEMADARRKPSTRVVTLEPTQADEHVAELLEVPVGTVVTYLERIRLGADQPLALLRNWLNGAAAQALTAAELESHGLYELLRARLVRPRVADRVIGAAAATRQQAKALGLRTGDPLVTVQLVMRDEQGSCFDLGRHVYDAARYTIEMRAVES